MPAGSQVQAISFRLISWRSHGCCMTGACLSSAASVLFIVVAAIQIPTSANLVNISSLKTGFLPLSILNTSSLRNF